MTSQNLVKAIRWIVYGLVAAVPLIFWPQVMFPYLLPKIALFQIGVELMAGIWLALIIIDKTYRPKLSVFVWALLAYIGSLSISLAFGVDPFRSAWSTTDRLIGVVGLLHFVVFALILHTLRDKFNWRHIWIVSFVASVVVAASVWMQKLGIQFILYNAGGRPGGVFGNAAFVSGFLLLMVFIGVWLFVESKIKWQKLLLILGILIIVTAIFFSQTIASMFGLVVGIGVLLIWGIIMGKNRIRSISIGIIALMAVSGMVFLFTRNASFWNSIPGVHRIASFSFQQSDVQDRLLAWSRALIAFKERPLLGWGWDNFNIPFNQHYDPKLLSVVKEFAGTVFDKPHNVFLEYLEAGGVVGFLAYIFLLGLIGYGILRKREHPTIWKPFFFAAFLAYCAQNVFVFDTIGTYFVLFLIFVFVSDREDRKSQEQPDDKSKISTMYKWIALIPIIIVFVPIYLLNAQMVRMFYNYYWGINYFMHQLSESSMLSWQKALAISTPYADYVKKDFASVIQQGLQQGIVFPDIQNQVVWAMNGLKDAEKHHPQDYLFPMIIADFYNTLIDKEIITKENSQFAVQNARHALELSPDRQQIFYILAKAQIVSGDISGAEALFEHAIALNPDAGDPHFFYGFLAYGTGDFKKGREEIAKAAELGRIPQDYKEAIALGNYVGDYEKNYKEAISYYKLGMALIGDLMDEQIKRGIQAELYLKLGVAYYLGGDNENARAAFTQLVRRTDIKQNPIYPQLAPVLKELGVSF